MSIIALTKWGNSVGIRIPAHELKAAGAYVGEKFQISVNSEGGFVLKPIRNPQAGWMDAFNAAADAQDDHLLIEELPTDFDKDEWSWD